jgi:hypothetical protein
MEACGGYATSWPIPSGTLDEVQSALVDGPGFPYDGPYLYRGLSDVTLPAKEYRGDQSGRFAAALSRQA